MIALTDDPVLIQGDNNTMKKLMTLMLGMALTFGSVAAFAQEKKEETKKAGKKGGKKKDDTKKKEGGTR